MTFTYPQYLVETAWLEAHLNDPDLRILDCTVLFSTDTHGFQVANELNRFAIGDRDPLRYNGDGSLDLYVQNQHPGADKQANWLPAPKAPFGLLLRLYMPTARVLHEEWAPPPLRER